jgi:hypothetical protein
MSDPAACLAVRDLPSVNAPDDRRGQDSGARCCYSLTRMWVEVLDGSEHPPQPPGVVVHPDGSDLREDNRPGMSLSDADSVTAAWTFLFRRRKLSRCRPCACVAGSRPGPSSISAYRASARPRSTAASSNTWAETSVRQERPVTCFVVVPSGATMNMRPALSLVFQRLNALIKSDPYHGTVADRSVSTAASASVTSRRL